MIHENCRHFEGLTWQAFGKEARHESGDHRIGSVGTSLARAIKGAGHDVTVASASRDSPNQLVQEVDVATASTNSEGGQRSGDA
jgi:hypothetical protein